VKVRVSFKVHQTIQNMYLSMLCKCLNLHVPSSNTRKYLACSSAFYLQTCTSTSTKSGASATEAGRLFQVVAVRGKKEFLYDVDVDGRWNFLEWSLLVRLGAGVR
jgi:hypothetical protein